jgi:hypothetical protein
MAVTPREIDFALALLGQMSRVTKKDMEQTLDWGGMRRRYRGLYLGQRGICGVCGAFFEPSRLSDNLRDHPDRPALYYVAPRLTGRHLGRNTILAHARCAHGAEERAPTAEEVAFARAVWSLALPLYAKMPEFSRIYAELNEEAA